MSLTVGDLGVIDPAGNLPSKTLQTHGRYNDFIHQLIS